MAQRNLGRLAWFESQLRMGVDDARVDYDGVMDCVLDRVRNAEREGELCVLKQHEIPNDAFWDRVEQRLSHRITEYEEYEEPVDECIGARDDLSDLEWSRVETGLGRAIDEIAGLPEWEQCLVADVVLPLGDWERIGEALDKRIEQHETRPGPVWMVLPFVHRVAARAVALLAVAAVVGVGGMLGYSRFFAPVPTYVYQANGANSLMVQGGRLKGGEFVSADGGSIKLVNRHGYVQLQNGASLTVIGVTKKRVRYGLNLAGVESGGRGIEGVKASFFVNRHDKGESFVLSTPDYDVHVVGTYFRVMPDLNERFTTEVLEGGVKVVSEKSGTLHVPAGHSLVYDREKGRYVVRRGGEVVTREEVDVAPGVDVLEDYGVLTVVSSVPLAGVTVDSRHVGLTPLRLLVPRGRRRVRVEREKYIAVDTTVRVGFDDVSRLYVALAEMPALRDELRRARADRSRRRAVASRDKTRLPRKREITDYVEKLETEGPQDILRRAESAELIDWREAMKLYRGLAGSPDASSLVKETAMFSVGKLLAEHHKEKTAAKEAFLRYLMLYPSGVFARESLLRLAELEFARDPDKAIEYYRKYFTKYPDHYRVSELQYRVGLIYLQKKQHEDAVYMFRQSLSNMLHDRGGMRKRIYAGIYRAMEEKGDRENARLVREKYLAPEQK